MCKRCISIVKCCKAITTCFACNHIHYAHPLCDMGTACGNRHVLFHKSTTPAICAVCLKCACRRLRAQCTTSFPAEAAGWLHPAPTDSYCLKERCADSTARGTQREGAESTPFLFARVLTQLHFTKKKTSWQ